VSFLLFDFDTRKKHETKRKSIFIKITLNCSLFNIFWYVVKLSRGKICPCPFPEHLVAAGCGRSCDDFCVLVRIILSNLTLRQRKYAVKWYESTNQSGIPFRLTDLCDNPYAINRWIFFTSEGEWFGIMQCYAIKRFMPLTNMRLTDFVRSFGRKLKSQKVDTAQRRFLQVRVG